LLSPTKTPQKTIIIDVFGSDTSNISFIRVSSNIRFEKAFEAGYKKKDATYRGLVNGNNATVLSLGHPHNQLVFTMFVNLIISWFVS
jgi:hypothetical protein